LGTPEKSRGCRHNPFFNTFIKQIVTILKK